MKILKIYFVFEDTCLKILLNWLVLGPRNTLECSACKGRVIYYRGRGRGRGMGGAVGYKFYDLQSHCLLGGVWG